MLLLLKIEISSIVNCCFIINQNELKFYLQLHGSSLKYIPLFSANLYWLGVWTKSHQNRLLKYLNWNYLSLVNLQNYLWLLDFRSHIENHVSNYRASSLIFVAFISHYVLKFIYGMFLNIFHLLFTYFNFDFSVIYSVHVLIFVYTINTKNYLPWQVYYLDYPPLPMKSINLRYVSVSVHKILYCHVINFAYQVSEDYGDHVLEVKYFEIMSLLTCL